MRWNYTKKDCTNPDIITKFLFLPCSINGETRWLETATIERMYEWDSQGGWYSNIRFID